MKKRIACLCVLAMSAAVPGWAAAAADGAAAKPGSGAGWPCWRGPNGSGSLSSGARLLEDISRARLVWKSEWIPGVYGAMIQSGNSGIILADGKVFLIYQAPNDDAYDQEYVRKMLEAKNWNAKGAYVMDPAYARAAADPSLREAYAKRKFAISADDVIHCFDAGSGKTLWKAVFEKKGFNPTKQGRGAFICAKCAPHSTPCCYKGKVYAIGSTCRVYCVDANTGKPVWESDLGAAFTALEAKKEKARAGKTLPEYGRMDNATGPTPADGVIVAYDDASSLIGFDPESGRKLWTARGSFGKYTASPVRWSWQGREYVIAGGYSKGSCVDPKTGRILWSVDVPPARESGTACVSGNYAVFGTTCFRITPEKATLAWTYEPSDKEGMKFITPAIVGDHVFFGHQKVGMVELSTGKVVATSAARNLFSIGSSMVGGDGRVFKEIGRDQGSGVLMAVADPSAFASKITILKTPHYAMSTTPVYCDGRLYFRMQDGVVCYDLRAK